MSKRKLVFKISPYKFLILDIIIIIIIIIIILKILLPIFLNVFIDYILTCIPHIYIVADALTLMCCSCSKYLLL